MWQSSGVKDVLEALPLAADGGKFAIVGDSIYHSQRSEQLLSILPSTSTLLDDASRKVLNRKLSAVRVCVEHIFAIADPVTKGLSSPHAARLSLLSPHLLYRFACTLQCGLLLCNLRTCVRGDNQVSTAFGLKPPSLSKYMGL